MRTLTFAIVLVACGGPKAPSPVLSGASAPSKGPTVLVSKRHPAHLAVGRDGIYWSEKTTDENYQEHATIFYLRDGGTPEVVLKRPGVVNALAVDADTLYVAFIPPDQPIDIRRIKRGGADEVVVPEAGASFIAFADAHIYWGTGGGEVWKRPLAGKQPTRLVENVEFSYMDGFAVGETSVFFSNELDDTARRIHRVAKSGGDGDMINHDVVVGAWALSGKFVYYAAAGAIWRVAADAMGEPAATKIIAGSLVGIDGDRMFYADETGKQLFERSLASGQQHALAVTLPDDITETVVARGALWFVRDPDSSADDPTGEILKYAP